MTLPLHERPGHPCKAENDDPQSRKVMEAGCVECGAALPSPSDAICHTCLMTAANTR